MKEMKIRGIFFQKIRSYIKPKPVIVASGPKVGSTWVYNMLNNLSWYKHGWKKQLKRKYLKYSDRSHYILLDDPNIFKELSSVGSNGVFKTHSKPPDLHELPPKVKLICIHRDLRDALVSLSYHTERRVRRGKSTVFQETFLDQNKNEQIKSLMNDGISIDKWLGWSKTNVGLHIFYEDLLKDTCKELEKIATYIHDGKQKFVAQKEVERIVSNNSFDYKSKTSNFFRKGVRGDWENYFDQDLKDYFKNFQNGALQGWLEKFKYEDNDQW